MTTPIPTPGEVNTDFRVSPAMAAESAAPVAAMATVGVMRWIMNALTVINAMEAVDVLPAAAVESAEIIVTNLRIIRSAL